ncbi:Protein yippee-like [Dendrobium catenatum]|uniref:Protein yippee-like n=1 Tax=Dendrobium catenatum TaxID=906689 RepID=A0A2I0WMG6_9ASPA|nr:Protein yippee-like [Dendrobium catenatum]
MGRLFLVNLDGKVYSCKHCQTHLALCEEIVSKVKSFCLRNFIFFRISRILVERWNFS